MACALVSHPADTLVSQIGKETNKGKSITVIAKEFGLVNLAVKGLGVRIVMIGTLTGVYAPVNDCIAVPAWIHV